MRDTDWEKLTAGDKKLQLYIKQKNKLDMFLARKAISPEQYKKSLGDMREKMGISDGAR